MIAGYRFDGPYYNETSLDDVAGVYAVLDTSGRVLYVGESGAVVNRLTLSHEWRGCWERQRNGSLQYAAHYMPGSTADQRRSTERIIRAKTNPPCGDY